MSDPAVGLLVYGVLAGLYALSVVALIRQRRRGERAPTRPAGRRIELPSREARTPAAVRTAS